MKNNSSVRLITLLQLLSDQLSPGQKRLIEAKVRENSEAHARLQQLRMTLGQTRTLKLETDIEPAIQRIAGFFDGTLNAEETLAFENECWESQRLLHDVIVLFQTGLETRSLHRVDSENGEPLEHERLARERLLGLFPAEPSASHRMNGTKTPIKSRTHRSNRSSNSLEEPAIAPPLVAVPQKSLKKPNKKSRFSNSTKVMVAIAVTVAIVVLSISVASWNWFHFPPTVVVESPNESNTPVQTIPTPKVAVQDDADQLEGNPDSHQSDRVVEQTTPDDLPRNTDRELPELNRPKMPIARTTDGLANTVDPKTNDSPETVDKASAAPIRDKARLTWTWDRLQGLVAVRSDGSNVWSGALSNTESTIDKTDNSKNERVAVERVAGLECKVLPLSWAQASLRGLGVLTVAENTDFFITSMPNRRFDNQSAYGAPTGDTFSVRINLRSGRLAIVNAKAESLVLVETSAGSWRIRITDPASVVIVEQGPNSRIFVQKGSVSVNGKELSARRQMVRAKDGRLEQMANRETIKWLKKPDYKFPSKQLSDKWLASRDLFADLSQPDAISPENQPFVRAAFATIDPPGQAALYLANVLPTVRAEGIHWLLSYGRDPQRLRQIADDLANKLGTPGLKATLPRLVMAIQRKRWPSKADSESLIAGLQSHNVSVRRLSHGFLVHLFGSLEDYNSESDAATRNVQSRKWLAAVNRLYRRLERARQR